jgi:GNAT superfamily N-acetyltransferase
MVQLARARGSDMDSAHKPKQSHVVSLGREHEGDRLRLLQRLGQPFCSTIKASQTVSWTAGAFIGDDLRGVVEIHDFGDPRFWILSLVVEPGWQRRGLGTALLEAAVSFAKSSDRTALRLIFSRRNWAMRHLALKANARLDIVLEDLWADINLDTQSSVNLDQQGRAS